MNVKIMEIASSKYIRGPWSPNSWKLMRNVLNIDQLESHITYAYVTNAHFILEISGKSEFFYAFYVHEKFSIRNICYK